MNNYQEMIKKYFEDRNAFDKDSAIEVEEHIEYEYDLDTYQDLVMNGVIQFFDGKYYYSLEKEKELSSERDFDFYFGKNRIKKIISSLLAFACVVVLGCVIYGIVDNHIAKPTKMSFAGATITIPAGYTIVEDKEYDNSYYIYPEDDPNGENGYLYFTYDGNIYTWSSEYGGYYRDAYAQIYESVELDEYLNANGDHVIDLVMSDGEVIRKAAFIFVNNRIVTVDVCVSDLSNYLVDVAAEIVDSVK